MPTPIDSTPAGSTSNAPATPAVEAAAVPAGAVSATPLAPISRRQTADGWATQLKTAAHIYAGAKVLAGWQPTQVLTQVEFSAGLDAFTGQVYGHKPDRGAPALTQTATGGYRRQQPQIMQGRAFGVSTTPVVSGARKTGRTQPNTIAQNAKAAADRLRALAGLAIPPPKK